VTTSFRAAVVALALVGGPVAGEESPPRVNHSPPAADPAKTPAGRAGELDDAEKKYIAAMKRNNWNRPVINPFAMQVGDVGHLLGGASYVVRKVLDDGRVLMADGKGGDVQFALKNPPVINPNGNVGERPISPDDIYFVSTVASLVLPSGAARNICVLERVRKDRIVAALKAQADKLEQGARKAQAEAKAKAERTRQELAEKREAARWHTWTSADGAHTIRAKFVKAVGGTVHLEKKGGTIITIQRDKLSDDDWKWIINKGWQGE